MRTILALAILLAAAPLAAAQGEPFAAEATLSVHLPREAAPGAELNATATVRNTLAREVAFTIGVAPSEGVEARVSPTRLVVPAGAEAQATLFVLLPRTTNVTHSLTVTVEEIVSNDSAAGRPPIVLRETLYVHVPAPPTGDPGTPTPPPPAIELRVEPRSLRAGFGNATTAKLIVKNDGPAIDAPRFEAFARGYVIAVAPVDVLPAASTSELVLRVRAVRDAASYDAVGTVRLVGHLAAPARFALSHETLPVERAAPQARALPTPPATPEPQPSDAGEAAAAATTIEAPTDDTLPGPMVFAAAAGAGASAGLWLTRRHWWPLLLPLYTRLRPSAILDHPVRRRIADLVQQNPGVTFGELARLAGIAPGQLTHHARMLERAGVVFSSPDGQTRRFFHVGTGRLASVPPLSQRVMDLLRERPRRSSELARELGVSRQALHYHVKHLVAEGKLVARADGRDTWLEPTSPSQPSSAASHPARS